MADILRTVLIGCNINKLQCYLLAWYASLLQNTHCRLPGTSRSHYENDLVILGDRRRCLGCVVHGNRSMSVECGYKGVQGIIDELRSGWLETRGCRQAGTDRYLLENDRVI